MSLTNLEVEYLSSYLKIPLISCCLQEELKYKTLQNGGYVINYGNIENGGTHYVAVYKNGDYAFCFDSFGSAFDTDVLKFISTVKNKAYNEWIIQDLDDDHCGFYCVAFLYFASQVPEKQLFNTANNFINRFKSENNLTVLKSMFAKLIKTSDIKHFNKNIYNKIKK